MFTKALSGLKITDASEGRVQAVFATFDVKDHDGDVTLKGAFGNQQVRISAYNHKSWSGALPVGKGTISETGDGAVLDGQFFVNTTHGADTFETVKQMGDLQEWSYGYDVDDSERGTKDGAPVRFLKALTVHEVSPVLLGAGLGTRTLAAKSRQKGCPGCQKSMDPVLGPVGEVKSYVCVECGHIDRVPAPVKQLASDLSEDLQDAGQAYATNDTRVYLRDYDTDENFAIYTLYGDYSGCQLLQVPFSRDPGTEAIVLDGENAQWVETETSYEPVGKARPAAPAGEQKAEGRQAPEPAPAPAKSEQPAGAGMKLADHLALVRGSVDEVTKRLRDVVALRAEKGKSPAAETVEGATAIADQLDAAAKALREVVTSADADQPAPAEAGLTLEDETQLAENLARLGVSL